jgi:hypothetical protein
MRKYWTEMERAFQEAKKRDTGMVSMIYDRDGMTPYSIRKCNKELAKHNLVFRCWSGKKFWKHRGSVVLLDPTKPTPRGWLTIADTHVFDAGGGCK